MSENSNLRVQNCHKTRIFFATQQTHQRSIKVKYFSLPHPTAKLKLGRSQTKSRSKNRQPSEKLLFTHRTDRSGASTPEQPMKTRGRKRRQAGSFCRLIVTAVPRVDPELRTRGRRPPLCVLNFTLAVNHDTLDNLYDLYLRLT